MKNTTISTRISHLNKSKLKRYYQGYSIRQLLLALIVLSETSPYVKNKIIETIEKEGEK